ncbi:MAG TPA: metallophosphoesterase [Tepidisphaeraceae bacterium]|jgi:3',5'-cyclic AMP phosphodiesterase CpdA
MRLLITADLHYDNAKSRESADALITQINNESFDILLLIGDASASAGEGLEACLSKFKHTGPRLFVPGNHELWTLGDDSYSLLFSELPARVRALGWHWLQEDPFITDALAIVGSVGWYDYSFAQTALGIPRRFYQRKVSPGAAAYFSETSALLNPSDDIAPEAMNIVARWNDGRFVKLHRPDEQFLDELLGMLRNQLTRATASDATVIFAATHHLPFRELLPPSHSAQWEFTKAYFGSDKIGQLLLEFEKVKHAYCGHSHFPIESQIQHIHAVNIGSGYRQKTFKLLDV